MIRQVFLILVVAETAELRRNLISVILNIPKEGDVISFNCTARGEEVKPKFWVLPDGRRIYVNGMRKEYNQEEMERSNENTIPDQDPANALNLTSADGYDNRDGDFEVLDISEDFIDFVNVSANQLTILGVRRGMDGQYICVVEGGRRQVFFIPYVIAKTDYLKSVLISFCVSLGFAVVCCMVLILDRYFLAPGSWRRIFSRKIHDCSPIESEQPMRTRSRKLNCTMRGRSSVINDNGDFSEQREDTHC